MRGAAISNPGNACIEWLDPAKRNEFRYKNFLTGYIFSPSSRASAYAIENPVAIFRRILGPLVAPNENLGIIAPFPDPNDTAIAVIKVENDNLVLPDANSELQNEIAARNCVRITPNSIPIPEPRRLGQNAHGVMSTLDSIIPFYSLYPINH